ARPTLIGGHVKRLSPIQKELLGCCRVGGDTLGINERWGESPRFPPIPSRSLGNILEVLKKRSAVFAATCVRVIVRIFSTGNHLAKLVLKLRTAHRFGVVVDRM